MEDWKPYQLYSLAEWINGIAFREINFSSKGLPVIKIAEIKNGLSGQTKYTDSEYVSKYFVENGDMLFCWSGQPETSIGTYWWKRGNGWLNQHIFKVLPDEKIVRKDYFYYVLQGLNPRFVQIARNKQTTGLGHVTKKDLENIEIRIPDFEEQKAIAKILSSLDDKIELNRQMNATLEAIARHVFKAWFVDFEPVRANSENRPSESASPEIAKLFPSEFENDIPKGWQNITFGDLFSFVVDNRGKTPPTSSEGFKLLEGYQIFCEKPFPDFSNSDKQKYVSEEIYNSLKWFRTKHPQYLDILCATVGTLPKWCFTPSYVDFGIAQNVVALRTNEKVSSPYFAKCLMETDNFLWNFNSRIVTTAQPSIKVGPLKAIPIVLPSKSLIDEFDRIAKPIYSRLEQNQFQNQSLTQIRDSLLTRLISGKIRVGKAENKIEVETE